MSEDIVQFLKQHAEQSLSLRSGQQLFQRGDPVRSIYLLDTGAMDVVRYQADGRELKLFAAGEGAILAEASLYSEYYHCSAVCTLPSRVVTIPKRRFKELLRIEIEFAEKWSAYLSHELQNARYRSELLTKKTVAERLSGWLEWHNGQLPQKGKWKSLAQEIGVSPEALYRELAKKR